MKYEIKVIVSKERGNMAVTVVDGKPYYDEILEGEELVTFEGFEECVKPLWDVTKWIESATALEFAEFAALTAIKEVAITLDGLDIDQVIDLFRWRGAI